MDISIVIPIYNEQDNVAPLYNEIKQVVNRISKDHKIIFIDDGSTDKTFSNLMKLKNRDSKVRIIKFRKNFGQTAALDAGFKTARGNIIVAIDADLQNDPNDIPKLLEKLKEGYDVVSGWRYKRNDPILKKIISWKANILRKALTGEKIHDSGCTLKAYKKECLEDLNLYGEMHRYIPAILTWKGFKVAEVKVNHRQRKYGKTKYSIGRVIKGGLDLLVILFWQKYSTRPIHLFGGLGLLSGALGFIIAAYLSILKIMYGISLSNRPLLIFAVLLMILGVQLIMFGFLADILIKVYYKDSKNYSIEKII